MCKFSMFKFSSVLLVAFVGCTSTITEGDGKQVQPDGSRIEALVNDFVVALERNDQAQLRNTLSSGWLNLLDQNEDGLTDDDELMAFSQQELARFSSIFGNGNTIEVVQLDVLGDIAEVWISHNETLIPMPHFFQLEGGEWKIGISQVDKDIWERFVDENPTQEAAESKITCGNVCVPSVSAVCGGPCCSHSICQACVFTSGCVQN